MMNYSTHSNEKDDENEEFKVMTEEYAEPVIENFQEEEIEKELKKQKKKGFRMSLHGFGRKRAGTIMDQSMGIEDAHANRNKSVIGIQEEDEVESFHEEVDLSHSQSVIGDAVLKQKSGMKSRLKRKFTEAIPKTPSQKKNA